MSEYRITFGQKYRHTTHPAGGWVRVDGWVSIFAENRSAAFAIACELFNRDWAFIYGEGADGPLSRCEIAPWFSAGELARHENGVLTIHDPEWEMVQ